LVAFNSIELLARWHAGVVSHFVSDPIDDRLAQVRLKGAFVPWLERSETLQGSHGRVLDEILGVGEVARPTGQPAPRPTAQGGQRAAEEPVESLAIASLRPVHQFERGLDRALRRIIHHDGRGATTATIMSTGIIRLVARWYRSLWLSEPDR
jgi:hypothetical protein